MSADPDPDRQSEEEILDEYLEAMERADIDARESIRSDYRRRYPRLASLLDRCDALGLPEELDPAWGRELVDRLFRGRYVFRDALGVGGMGFVYRAFDVELGREVAIKMIRPRDGDRPESRLRFLKEMEAMRLVDHENVMRILDSGEVDGYPYFVMPVLNGATLKRHLDEGRPLHPAAVAWLGEQVALGLAALHAHGLVHRDLKPSNIGLEIAEGMPGRDVCPYGVVLMDLGLVRVGAGTTAPKSAASSLTDTGALPPGTIPYMAPEQFVEALAGKNDSRSDLFSLGCVLYELATGRRAFVGLNDAAILVKIATHDPDPLRDLNPQIPTALSKFIMQLLQKDPARRPNGAVAVAECLWEIRRQMGPKGPLLRALSTLRRATKSAQNILGSARRLASSAWGRRWVRWTSVGASSVILLLAAVCGLRPYFTEANLAAVQGFLPLAIIVAIIIGAIALYLWRLVAEFRAPGP